MFITENGRSNFFLPIHFKLPVAFPCDRNIGKVASVQFWIAATQYQLPTLWFTRISGTQNNGNMIQLTFKDSLNAHLYLGELVSAIQATSGDIFPPVHIHGM